MPLPGTRARKFEAANAMKQVLDKQNQQFVQTIAEQNRLFREIASIAQAAFGYLATQKKCVISNKHEIVCLVKFSSMLYMNVFGEFLVRRGPNENYTHLEMASADELATHDVDKCLDRLLNLQKSAITRNEKQIARETARNDRARQKLARFAQVGPSN